MDTLIPTDFSESTSRILNYATRIALQLPFQYRLAAVITDKKGNILSVGINSYTKTHPKQKYWSARAGQQGRIYLHAEIDAIRRIRFGKPYAIYISRATPKGGTACARPCKACELAIKHEGIKEVHYTL